VEILDIGCDHSLRRIAAEDRQEAIMLAKYRRVTVSRDAVEETVEKYERAGYSVVGRTPYSTVMAKKRSPLMRRLLGILRRDALDKIVEIAP